MTMAMRNNMRNRELLWPIHATMLVVSNTPARPVTRKVCQNAQPSQYATRKTCKCAVFAAKAATDAIFATDDDDDAVDVAASTDGLTNVQCNKFIKAV